MRCGDRKKGGEERGCCVEKQKISFVCVCVFTLDLVSSGMTFPWHRNHRWVDRWMDGWMGLLLFVMINWQVGGSSGLRILASEACRRANDKVGATGMHFGGKTVSQNGRRKNVAVVRPSIHSLVSAFAHPSICASTFPPVLLPVQLTPTHPCICSSICPSVFPRHLCIVAQSLSHPSPGFHPQRCPAQLGGEHDGRQTVQENRESSTRTVPRRSRRRPNRTTSQAQPKQQ